MPETSLYFLKLGGSLITEKSKQNHVQYQVLERLGKEIQDFQSANSNIRILIGHGSGSFGHVPAKKHNTRDGVYSWEDWKGFVDVWYAAARLNRYVTDALKNAGLPVVCFPPSSNARSSSGIISNWNTFSIEAALEKGLLPIVYGDVVFDDQQGGTIASTEDLFSFLSTRLQPKKILIAGIEPGVWADFPACTTLIKEIEPSELSQIDKHLSGSQHADVTGGMDSKVNQMIDLVARQPGLEVQIFSGVKPGNVKRVLNGTHIGTRLWSGE